MRKELFSVKQIRVLRDALTLAEETLATSITLIKRTSNTVDVSDLRQLQADVVALQSYVDETFL